MNKVRPPRISKQMKDRIILGRTPADPLGPRDVFAASTPAFKLIFCPARQLDI